MVAFDPALAQGLEKQAVTGRSPIAFKTVSPHVDAVRVHDGDAGTVAPERVALIRVSMGIHEMQAVAGVGFARVAGYAGVAREFKIDPVPVPPDHVIADGQAVAFPKVQSVAIGKLSGPESFEGIAPDDGSDRLQAVNSEEHVFEAVVFDMRLPCARDPDRAMLLEMADADIAEGQVRNRDPVRSDLEYGLSVAGVQDGAGLAADGDRPLHHQSGLVVKALREDEGVARAGG